MPYHTKIKKNDKVSIMPIMSNKDKLKDHSKHHSKKHINAMKVMMDAGLTFKKAHNLTTKIIGNYKKK
jgi:hypothetical protein